MDLSLEPEGGASFSCVTFEVLTDIGLEIGESPVWDDAREVLWFVDVLAPAVMCLTPSTRSVRSYPMPAPVGSMALAHDGRLVVALRTGVHLFDPGSGELAFLVHPEPDRAMNRLNDGKVGPDGCFWVGSMHDALPRAPTGALYRVTPAGACTRVLDGIKVSNGLAWSPDGRTMYHADSRGPFVRAFDFNAASGEIANPRLLLSLTEEQGLPDGAAVDRDGIYWSAGVTAGRINGISAGGVLVGSVVLPVSAPTMPCFGGADLRTVYVTSLASDRSGRHQPGTLIAFRSEVPGLAVGRFGEPAAAKASKVSAR
ncbi:MAG: SMP-30/gluconolactonase/LRE family protein [Phreatobacter sp.]